MILPKFFQLDIMQEPKPVRSSSLGICACFTQECDRSVEDDVAGIKFNGKRDRKRDKELEHVITLFRYL
jgi:hypothetical protein